MFLYTAFTAVAAIVVGLVLAFLPRKAPNVTYGRLDKLSRVTNIVMLVLYSCACPFAMFLGMVSSPRQEGMMGILGWIVSVIIASPALLCGIGVGASVALRKKGRSVAGFAVQFVGIIGIVLSFVLYAAFVGTLLAPLN